jgi:predicted dehydrogenase
MGRNHARLYFELAGVEPVGLADTDYKLTQSLAEKSHTRPFSDYKELLSNNLDAVSIAVPTSFHREVAHFGPTEWLDCRICADPAKAELRWNRERLCV